MCSGGSRIGCPREVGEGDLSDELVVFAIAREQGSLLTQAVAAMRASFTCKGALGYFWRSSEAAAAITESTLITRTTRSRRRIRCVRRC